MSNNTRKRCPKGEKINKITNECEKDELIRKRKERLWDNANIKRFDKTGTPSTTYNTSLKRETAARLKDSLTDSPIVDYTRKKRNETLGRKSYCGRGERRNIITGKCESIYARTKMNKIKMLQAKIQGFEKEISDIRWDIRNYNITE